jgi:hypothetical protein
MISAGLTALRSLDMKNPVYSNRIYTDIARGRGDRGQLVSGQ